MSSRVQMVWWVIKFLGCWSGVWRAIGRWGCGGGMREGRGPPQQCREGLRGGWKRGREYGAREEDYYAHDRR